jgi:hypothetical protein
MTLSILIYCPLIAWTASTGAVDHYDVYLDGVVDHSVTEPETDRICIHDEGEHVIAVVGVSAGDEESEPSDDLSLTFTVGPAHRRVLLEPVVQADMNGDGIVSIIDFGMWVREFGACHDGRQGGECE